MTIGRRNFLVGGAAAVAVGTLFGGRLNGQAPAQAPADFFIPGAFARQLTRTPRQTEGPFYPVNLPLDSDNDLLIINDSITPAVGAVTHLGGRILDARGEPVRDAVVEIWQVDGRGVYLHPWSDNAGRRDTNFQGFGRFVTGSTGEYRFRTIKPVRYPGRTPHIHFAVKIKGRDKFTTQCYVRGEPGNERDGVLRGILDPRERESVVVDFAPLKGSKIGELAAKFDIVLGFTPGGRRHAAIQTSSPSAAAWPAGSARNQAPNPSADTIRASR